MIEELDEQLDEGSVNADTDWGGDEEGAEDSLDKEGRPSKRSVSEKTRGAIERAQEVKNRIESLKSSGEKIAKSAKKVAQVAKALAAVPWPVWAGLLILAIIVLIFSAIFTSGKNKISSLAGGSIFVGANYDNPEDRQIVNNLQGKLDNSDPAHKLVINDISAGDLDWQLDSDGEYAHPLDIRLLKTLDYLTSQHDYVEIGLLKTGAPTFLRENLRVKAASITDPISNNEGELEKKETFSAFYTGQAMAIIAVDYSRIDPLRPNKDPVYFSWQTTILEKIIRPLWEELSFNVGYLDDNSKNYQQLAQREVGDLEIDQLASKYLDSIRSKEPNVYKEGFMKIDRIIELLDRISQLGLVSKSGMDPRTIAYFNTAESFFHNLKDKIGDPASSVEAVTNAIRALGDNVALIRDGAKYIYKATQVANMVGWNEKGVQNKIWNQAYEARNKIRQVVKELLEMPRETSDYITRRGDAIDKFNEEIVVKQIITYSPEDDLDNGLVDIDVFPEGITAVDVGGVAIEGTSTETTTDADGNMISGVTIGDGIVDAADTHFSYKPIDNGVFSKHGTNYIFVNMPDNVAEGVVQFLKATVGLGAARALFDYWAGICKYNPLNESCQPVTYKGFLQVAF